MICKFIYADTAPNEEGKRAVQCVRWCCSNRCNTKAEPELVLADCLGWPFWWEFGYWIETILKALYIGRWLHCISCGARAIGLNQWGEWLRSKMRK